MMRQTQQIQTYDLSLPDNQDYRKSLQRLRWFRATFAEQIAAIETPQQSNSPWIVKN